MSLFISSSEDQGKWHPNNLIRNRSERLLLSIPLILYGTTHLCKLPNRPGGLFYPLALSRLVYLLHELPNRPDGIFYPLAFSRLA